jgi:hypothetical protein
MIPSFSHITIRVTYRPAEVGNFSYILRIENTKDPNSVHSINVQSSVVSELRPVRNNFFFWGRPDRVGVYSCLLSCTTPPDPNRNRCC